MSAVSIAPNSVEAAGAVANEFHRFMRSWATGVAIVTSLGDSSGGNGGGGDDAGEGESRVGSTAVGCTVTALASVSLDPPLLLVSLAEDSRTLAAVRGCGLFGVSVLPGSRIDLAERFATFAGDRFAGVAHHYSEGVPLLDDALAVAACTVERIISVADHSLVLGLPGRCEGHRDLPPLIRFDSRFVR